MLKTVEKRFDKLLDMTSAKRLWLGFGVLIALLVIMGLIIGLRIGLLEKTLMELTVVKEPLHAVSYKLGVNLMENGIAVLQYLGSGDPVEQARLLKAHDEFDRLIRQYDELTDSPEAKRRISILTSNEDESYTLGNALMNRSDSLRAENTKVARAFDEMNDLLDQGLGSKIDRARPDWFTKLEEAALMEKDSAKLGAAVMNFRRTTEAKYETEYLARAKDFEEGLERFRALRLTGTERYWATQLDDAFRTLSGNVNETLARDAHQARDLARFIALRREIETIYEEIRIPTETGLLIAKESTHRSVNALFVTLMILIVGGVVTGAGSAIALTAAITKTERSLRDQREEFRVTLASIGDGVIVTDRDGRVMFLNDLAESLTGCTSAASLGKDLSEIFRIIDDATRLPLNGSTEPSTLLRSGDGPSLRRTALLAHDGKETAIEYSASAIGDRYGEIHGIVVVVRDITERRRAEETLKDDDRRKDEFLAILGHELRNPLATIHNALQILNERPANPTEIEEARGMMGRQVQVLKQLVDDLLEVSRVTHGKIELHRERIDVANAVASAVEATRALVASNRHTLSVALPSEPIFVDADPIRLEQSLTNLLTNAAKYTPAEGRIRLIVTRDANEAVISVIDTGIGIAPEALPRIFESFQQVHPSDSPSAGLGIGLTLSRRLVELHGGRMEARSAGIGGGSEFVVRLPAASALAPGDERRDAAPTPAERETPSAARAVLIVEDNVDGAASLSMLLRSMGHTVTVAHDGPTAIELTKLATFDVVLLDIGLPKMSGHQVASTLRERAEMAETVLIAMTGYGQERDKHRARASGFDHFLTKPVDLAMLGRILANPKHAMLTPDA